MRREQASKLLDKLIVTLTALGEPYCSNDELEALKFAKKNVDNTSILKGMLIFDKTQCQIGGWKDRLKAIETAQVLFDKYLED